MEHQKPKTSLLSNILILVFFIGLSVGAGWLHLATQPQEWRVSARFDAPKVAELGNFYSLKSTYRQVQNDGNALPHNEQEITAAAFDEFKQRLTALDDRLEFLTNNTLVQQTAAVNHQPTAVFARQLAEKLKFDSATGTLSFQLVNPDHAATVLSDFIQKSSLKARENLNNDLIQQWKLLFQQVKQSADANLGEQWQAKLTLMRSVQPLDNQLVPYHFIQKPIAATKPALPDNLTLVLALCAGFGALLGLFVIALRRK
ncbi:hypothetical protein E4T80_06265 [Muribacter muris]|uniref:Polysaccharide chain length determinant N-terminal domain-containing protein n=1 Tax=Muribacter muris TaxID=67855 RepID=A0A4Y9JYH8_9PAST|nr:hypothetical protein [Muribacter muris]MBF0785072.1 hypothetical protein [Muribacter muris]MBF0826713.1 hypothetical protein [Muribacter muris]TFV10312.1 hypothetical protein E4T80_06265 [Muribacter muris]